jgi:hypothetical protein
LSSCCRPHHRTGRSLHRRHPFGVVLGVDDHVGRWRG